jgi:hypothetical protein
MVQSYRAANGLCSVRPSGVIEYSTREVDFADASLIWLANRRGTTLIATTDFDDCSISMNVPRNLRFIMLI